MEQENKKEQETKYIGFRLDCENYDKLSELANNNMSSVSRTIRLAILEYLKKNLNP